MLASREINVPLLRKTLEHVREHPEEWQQHSWGARVPDSCGTVGCFAHHAARLDGGELVGVSRVVAVEDDDRAVVEWVVGRDTVHVSDRAERVLGLTSDESLGLFSANNTLGDLERIVAGLIEQAEG